MHTVCMCASVAIRRAGSHPPFVRFWRPGVSREPH